MGSKFLVVLENLKFLSMQMIPLFFLAMAFLLIKLCLLSRSMNLDPVLKLIITLENLVENGYQSVVLNLLL